MGLAILHMLFGTLASACVVGAIALWVEGWKEHEFVLVVVGFLALAFAAALVAMGLAL